MTENKSCLQCDDGTLLESAKRDLLFTYREVELTVPKVAVWHCPTCGECQFDGLERQRYSEAVDNFSAAVDRNMNKSEPLLASNSILEFLLSFFSIYLALIIGDWLGERGISVINGLSNRIFSILGLY